ncbi:hypothetical protein KC19_7G161600 [Ceratodon purpureus]|uniref:Uncharacterized protein n=1 Tax=Ceratodon purpureus TaxID=3225 RepID=A0A8T0HAV0_CERPU|nr:hypothetical protein KC19_7G161600 [Ceratodon purpureus]
MASLGHGLSMVDHTEQATNGHAKEGVSDLDSIVESIQTTLESIERPRGRKNALWNSSRRTLKSARSQPREANAGLSHAKNLKDQLSSQGLKEVAKALTDMATAIEPIASTFDKILGEQATKNFNATLNTVPVVGIKGDKLMYLQTRLNSAGTEVEEFWTVFSGLPGDVHVAPDAANIFLFPFAGALCLAIGQKVWRKVHDRPDADEASRARAMDDWPELYVDHWDKVGDTVLPAGELRGVVPYSTFSAEKKAMDFHVVVLKGDGSLHALEGLKGSSIKPLAFDGDNASAPKLWRIAYWDDQIVGYDDANNMVSIKVNFTEKTFSVVDKTPDTAIMELTADEAGPIVVRDDGFLYKRVVQVKKGDTGNYTWSKWVSQDGVTHLAVASPGVFLSLNTFARALKTRYVATQTALHPIMSKLSDFCATHEIYVEQMQKAVSQYNAAASDAEKHAIAVKQGRAFVDHAKPWSMILHLSVDGSKEIVNNMMEELSNVHDQLKLQLHFLLEKLMGLQPLLKDPNETMDRVRATFYGALGAKFLGMAMAVTDSEIPGVTLSGGALAIGALVAAILEGKKVSELSGKIHADTESQVAGVTKAGNEIRALVDSYDTLHAKFDIINLFWRSTSNDANSLGAVDDATAEKIGRELLEDESSITSAMQTTSELGDACKLYVDALHKLGVTPAMVHYGVSTHMLFHKGHHGPAHQKHAHHGQSAAHRQNSAMKSASLQKDLHESFHRHVQEAQGKLKAHDQLGYVSAINQARFISFATIASAVDTQVVSGHWFDVPLLSWNASVWNGYRAPIHVGLMAQDEISNAQRRMNGALAETKPLVVSLLKEIVQLGKTFRRWKGKFPQPPVSAGRANPEFDKLKKDSLEQCKAGEEIAGRAYSRFSVFERQAMKWQQERESEIAECQDAIRAAQAARQDAKVARLETTISQLRELQQSGNAFYRNAYTWIRMCEQVGEMLGGHIHNILIALAHPDDDPTLYNALMGTDWTKIGNDASTLLNILGVHIPHHVGSPKSNGTAVPTRSVSAVSKTNQTALVRSLSPDGALGDILKSQAESAKAVFDAVNAITQLPSSGLVAYWDDARESKTTMLDVAHHMRDQYVQLVATEYDVIEKLYTLSILQVIRAFNYAEQGKIPLDALIKVSFQSFSAAFHVANRAANEYSNSASEFDSALSNVNENLANVHEKIDKAVADSKNMDDHKKEIVSSTLAEAIAAAVSSPMAFAASGVASSVTQTLIQSTKMGLGSAGTADNLKLAVRDLRPNELTNLIQALQVVKEHCDATAKQLAAVQPLFHKLVDGLKDVAASLLESSNSLHSLLQRVTTLGALGTITTDDVTHIESKWKKMAADARVWMDAIDAQNISHVTFSVHM